MVADILRDRIVQNAVLIFNYNINGYDMCLNTDSILKPFRYCEEVCRAYDVKYDKK